MNHRTTKIAAIILSGGASRRMGFPKALLDIGGRSGLDAIVDTCGQAGLSPILVVTSRDCPDLLQLAGVEVGSAAAVVNPNPDAGRTGSIQRGLEAIPSASRHSGHSDPVVGALIWPVDLPRVDARSADSIAAQLGRLEKDGWVVPTYEGRGGHPIGVRAGVWPLIRAMAPDEPLRELLRRDIDSVTRIELDDPAILDQMNSPKEAARILGTPVRMWWSSPLPDR